MAEEGCGGLAANQPRPPRKEPWLRSRTSHWFSNHVDLQGGQKRRVPLIDRFGTACAMASVSAAVVPLPIERKLYAEIQRRHSWAIAAIGSCKVQRETRGVGPLYYPKTTHRGRGRKRPPPPAMTSTVGGCDLKRSLLPSGGNVLGIYRGADKQTTDKRQSTPSMIT